MVVVLGSAMEPQHEYLVMGRALGSATGRIVVLLGEVLGAINKD